MKTCKGYNKGYKLISKKKKSPETAWFRAFLMSLMAEAERFELYLKQYYW